MRQIPRLATSNWSLTPDPYEDPKQGVQAMSDSDRSGRNGAPADPKETIKQLTAEVERLRGRLAVERYGDELRDALVMAATVGTIASPVAHSRLLEMIVE